MCVAWAPLFNGKKFVDQFSEGDEVPSENSF